MISYALEGDFKKARALNDSMLTGYDLLFAENNPAGVKAFLSEMGLIENHLRLPLVPLSEGILKGVRDYLPTIHK